MMKAGPTVKPLFFAIAFLFFVSSALKLSDVVHLRKQLHKMELNGNLPLGRKLAEVPAAPRLKDFMPPTFKNKKNAPTRKLKGVNPPQAHISPKGVQLLQSPRNSRPARRLKTHKKALANKPALKNSITPKGSKPDLKAFGANKKRAQNRSLTDKAPALSKAPVASKKNSFADIPPSHTGKTSRSLKMIPHSKQAKVKKVARIRKAAAKQRAGKVRKALAQHKAAGKQKKRKAAQSTRGHANKAHISNKPHKRVAKQAKNVKNEKENMALAAMNTAGAAPVTAKPPTTVTERKLLDLPSQNEFYERIIDSYYPTI